MTTTQTTTSMTMAAHPTSDHSADATPPSITSTIHSPTNPATITLMSTTGTIYPTPTTAKAILGYPLAATFPTVAPLHTMRTIF
ncbi:unnamed protein product [Schistocephalus solidus]|uniref:Uncharacterized protein n=1 Tax=Schistocephalus solidus TaxID=70667 RepID=A0A183SEN4_SCHSO|nr:unnamed protein product [Schistocephalus solidus]